MQSFDFKKLLPHLVIVGVILLISLLYSYPALQGQELITSDNVSWKAAAHEGMEWHEKTGENVLWSNSMFSGMPTYTFYVGKITSWFVYIQTAITEVLPKPAYFFFIAMLGFYVLMVTMRINRWLGLVGAIAYAFATYNAVIIAVGHETKMLTMGYIPLVLSGLIMVYRGNYFYGGVLLCASFALFSLASHLQVMYYVAIVIFMIVIGFFVIALREKRLKRFFIASGISLLAFIVGLMPGMSNLWPVQEYSKYTMRGGESELTFNHDEKKGGLDKDYAFAWSNGIGETFCIMIPYLYGGSSSEPIEKAPRAGEILAGAGYASVPLYWGPQDMGISGPMYFGAIVCFLFVLGMMVVRSPHKWWIIGASLITIMMSWGKNFPEFNFFLFDNLPFYNKFRTPSTALVIAQFLFPMLGIWGVMEIINGKVSREDALKKLKIALGITAGLCILLGVGGSLFFDFSNPATEAQYPQQLVSALKEDRADLAMESGIKSALFILLAGGVLWAFITDKIKANAMIAGIGLLITIDLISVANNYLNEDNYREPVESESVFQPRPVDQQILQDPDPYYRVLDLSRNVYNDAVQAYFHKCIGGYSPAKLEIYQDLIDVHMSKTFNAEVLNMLNTKYIIYNDAKNTAVAQVNPDANGNAWFVDSIQWAKTADEEILSMKGPALGDTATVSDPWNSESTVIVRETHRDELGNYKFGRDSVAKISLSKYGLNHIYYQSTNSQDGLGVFSEVYYEKGWEAYIDGKQVPIVRVNWLLRAIKIPAGTHNIEFHFRPKSYEIGANIAIFSSLLLYGLCVTAIIMALRNKKFGVHTEDE